MSHPETQSADIIGFPVASRPEAWAQPEAVMAFVDAAELEQRRRERGRQEARTMRTDANRGAFDASPWPCRLQFIIAAAEPGWLLVALAALAVALAFKAGLV